MHRWFHPNLSSVEAERLLRERGSDGSFLVRPSKSLPGQFSLSVRRRDKVTHIKIRHLGDFYDLHGGDQFATLAELIQHYKENGLHERDGGVLFELKMPIISSDPTTERWFHGSISGDQAERLIKDKGVNGSFLVRESQSKIGDYVLTVQTADKVSQVMIRNHNNKYDVGGGPTFDTLTELVEYYKRNPMVETNGTVVIMKQPFNATSITALDIDTRVNELSKENNGKEGFWEEFEHLQHQECKVLLDRKVGQEDRNMLKNRYKNILPYDYTRVILKKPNLQAPQHQQHQHQQKPLGSNSNSGRSSILSLGGLNSKSSSSITTLKNEQQEIDSGSDYINANYIKLVNDDGSGISPRTKPVPHSKVYIATQGPLPNTVGDFWLMVWQEKAECILMVTQEVERTKNKCFRYWPTLEQKTLVTGSFEITILNDTIKRAHEDEYNIREFDLRYLGASINDIDDSPSMNSQNNTNDHTNNHLHHHQNHHLLRNNGTIQEPPATGMPQQHSRRIIQYQYRSWPDQNTPTNPRSVLSFLQDINRHPPRSPVIVHCSAGIGRSGTLIVIDMLMDQLEAFGLSYEIDIQRIVKIARAQRSGLVQTEAQYKFIYLAIRNYIASMRQQH